MIRLGQKGRIGAAAAGAICALLLVAAMVPGCMRMTMRSGGWARQSEKRFSTSETSSLTARDSTKLRKLLGSYLGTPYRRGGMSREGVDCSGLACVVYRDLWNIRLPRSAPDQMREGVEVPIDRARPGDLLFFRWGRLGGPDHVGIYTIEGRFIHASKTLGVIESTLDDDYYLSHFIAARRVLL